MLYWEKHYLFECELFKFVKSYYRFLDDIFILWEGPDELIEELILFTNNSTTFLRFTHEINLHEINYLDIKLQKNYNTKKYKSSVYRKKHYSNAYLHFDSDHPSLLKNNIVMGQMIRAARMTSDREDFLCEVDNVQRMFQQRGYPFELTQSIKEYVIEKWDTSYVPLLNKQNNTNNIAVDNNDINNLDKKTILPYLTLTYDKGIGWLKKCINETWEVFKTMPSRVTIFQNALTYSYRRNQNLKNIFERKKHLEVGKVVSNKRGTFRCGRCPQCPFIAREKELWIPSLGMTLKAKNTVAVIQRGWYIWHIINTFGDIILVKRNDI